MFHLSGAEEQQAAFQKDKDILNTLDHDLTFQKSASYLHLTSTSKYIGALLAQKVEGVEHPIYYLSRSFRYAKTNYSSIERHSLAIIFATQKLRSGWLAHSTWSQSQIHRSMFIKTSHVRTYHSMASSVE